MVEELEFVPTGIKNDAGEEIFLIVSEYGRGDHNQAYVKRNGNWLRSRYPDLTSKLVETSSSNPYKKVWNTEEAYLQDQAKNLTLFIPTYLEMARRHMATSRSYLYKAKKLGSCASGYIALDDAMSYRNLARQMLDRHQQVLRLSR